MRRSRLRAKLLVVCLLGATFVTPVASAQQCAGDCDDSGNVTISELIRCVNIALGQADVGICSACDPNGDGTVQIFELIRAVSSALCACQPCATPTATRSAPPATATPPPTATAAAPTATQPPVTAQDGGVLFGERCVDCHEKFGSDISDGSSAGIVAAIEDPSTGMESLQGLFSSAQIDAMSRYLTTGEHSLSWSSSRNHGRFADQNGVDNCEVCHGGPDLMGEGPAPTCFLCHGMIW